MLTNRFFDITAFEAAPGGAASCTQAFASAVAAAARAGGGTIYVPAGVFLTGPIRFTDNMTLYLETGARIVFSRDPAEYPIVRMRWEGAECDCHMPQLFGEGLRNIAVAGRGEIDGQGEPWWKLHRERRLAYPRPRLLSFVGCRHVLIEGVQLINSPSWTINPILCEDVTVDKVTIVNQPDSPNTDGINPESCRNVRISNCHIDVGDDCIAIKAGRENCLPRAACENITISNCTMVHGHGGVVIGSEMSGDVRNVVIANCIFESTDRGIRIKSRRGRGGVVEDVRVSNIIMRNVICPFVLHLYYNCGEGGCAEAVWDKKQRPVTAATPAIRRIHFSDITAGEVRAAAGFIYGLPEMPIEQITFDHISVRMAADAPPALPAMMSDLEPMSRQGFICCNVRDVSFSGISISGQEGPAYRLANARGIEWEGSEVGEA